ncbi:hypothetical protein AAVH_27633 [Aphelenchoides avenae]|nr:hypothetical protein AAVH_27633 [Aphelenchus avenae]
MCFSCAAFVPFCAALTASFAIGFNTFLGALLFGLAVIVALVDVVIIEETLFHCGNKTEAKPTDNESVLRFEGASSRGLELDVAATTQTEDRSDTEEADSAADENVANDVPSPTEGESASDMAHEENTERKFIEYEQ